MRRYRPHMWWWIADLEAREYPGAGFTCRTSPSWNLKKLRIVETSSHQRLDVWSAQQHTVITKDLHAIGPVKVALTLSCKGLLAIRRQSPVSKLCSTNQRLPISSLATCACGTSKRPVHQISTPSAALLLLSPTCAQQT